MSEHLDPMLMVLDPKDAVPLGGRTFQGNGTGIETPLLVHAPFPLWGYNVTNQVP